MTQQATRHIVVTFTGPDRPGVVDHLAQIVHAHGGNWEASRMASLAGRFAGILEVTIAEQGADALLAGLYGAEDLGLKLIVESGSAEISDGEGERLRLDITGVDHPGIVRQVAHVLAERGVNIIELESVQRVAAMSGEPVFHASVLLECPSSVSADALQDALEQVAHDLVVTIGLQADREG